MATYTESYEIEFPKQSVAEEIANTVTHGIGLCLSVIGFVGLLILGSRLQLGLEQLVGITLYGAALIAVFGASTFSHAIQEPRQKQFFRVLDQAVIYCLIAATYTPFILAYMPPERKWLLFAVVWSLAAVGFLSKALLKHRVEMVAVANYILLGWVPAAAMVNLMPFNCVMWMLAGGILYTLGALFLTLDQRVPFFHATWHAFVLGASAVHFFSVLHFTMIAGV